MKELIRETGFGIIILDKSGTILNINIEAFHILQIEARNLQGQKCEYLVPNYLRNILKAEFQRFVGGDDFNMVFTLADRNGDNKPARAITITGQQFQHPQGENLLLIVKNISHYRELELALKESHLRFKQLSKQSRSFEWQVDAEGLYVQVDELVEEVIGFTPQELIGKKHYYDLHPEQGKEAFKILAKNVFDKKGVFNNVENKAISKSGKQVWLSTSGSPLLDSSGNLSGYWGIDRDITYEKESAELLKVKNNAIETAINAIAIANLSGELIYVNKSFVEMWGYDDDKEILGKVNVDLMANQSEGEAIIEELIRDGKYTGKSSGIRKNGELFHVKLNASIVLGEDDKPAYFMSAFEDITQQLKAEKQFMENKIRYKTVANYTHSWEYWLDPKGQIRYISPSSERITGYKAAEFMKDPTLFHKIVHSEDTARWDQHRKNQNNNQHSSDISELQFRIQHKDGGLRWVMHQCRHIFDEEQNHLGLRVSNRDITRQVEAENKLLQSTIHIEERERKRIAMELHDGLGPVLSSMKLYFEWLSEYVNDAKTQMILEQGNKSLNKAIEITREISNNLSPRILDKFGFVTAALDFAECLNKTKKVNINFRFNQNKRLDKYVEIALYRITTELIQNTLRHGNATKIQIGFFISEQKRLAELNYKDNGKGFVLMEAMEKQGMGIPNIEQRVKSLGGVFKLQSSEDKGMKADICLPIAPKQISTMNVTNKIKLSSK